MNKRTRVALAGALAATVTGGSLAVTAATTTAHAGTTVPWTDPTHRVDTPLTLKNVAGAAITYGRVDQPLAASASAGSAVGGGSLGSLFLYTPGTGQSGSIVTGDGTVDSKNALTSATDFAKKLAGDQHEVAAWTGLQLDGSSAFSGTAPTARLSSDAVTVKQYAAAYPSAVVSSSDVTADNGKLVYEVRLRTSSPGTGASASYAAADIVVDGDTWHLYGQSAPSGTTTRTTLSVTPSGVTAGGALTLAAAVTPTATGTVDFFDNGVKIGATQAVASGSATVSVPSATVGTHDYSAVFTGRTGFLDSSDGTTYTVAPKVATQTTTTVQVTSAAGKRVGESLDLKATVAPATAGSVQFKVGGANAGAAVQVDGSGVATTTYTPAAAGALSVTATFAPTAPADFAPSTSAPATYTVLPKDTSVEDAKAAKIAQAQSAYDAAASTESSTATALEAAAAPKTVKAYVKALAAQAKAQAKVTAATAKVKAAKASSAKKKAKKALASAKKVLTKAKKATTKAKKKAGAGAKKYDAALAAHNAAVKAKADKAAALAAAKAGQ